MRPTSHHAHTNAELESEKEFCSQDGNWGIVRTQTAEASGSKRTCSREAGQRGGNGLPVTKGDADDQKSARDRKGGVSGGGRGGAGLMNHHKLTLRVSGMGLGAPLGKDGPAWLTSLAHSRCTISV